MRVSIVWACTSGLIAALTSCSRPTDTVARQGLSSPCDTLLVADTALAGVTNADQNSVALTSWARRRGGPTFEDFLVPVTFHGAPVAPRFSEAPGAGRFRTVIQDAVEHGPNFADRYTVVMWGCGSPCVSLAIVDAATGQITFIDNPAPGAPMFRRDSRLLVFDGAGYLTDSLGRPMLGAKATYAEWQDGRLRTVLTLDADSVRIVPSELLGASTGMVLRPIAGAAPDVKCWDH